MTGAKRKKLIPIQKYFYSKGFTLIELLVVIGILAVLLAVVLVAINPARQFAQAGNTQRRSDISNILNAIHQYAAENAGRLPPGIPAPGNTANIATVGTGQTFCSAITPMYIASLPKDPKATPFTNCLSYDTRYRIIVATDSGGVAPNTPRLTIDAPDAELGITVAVTR